MDLEFVSCNLCQSDDARLLFEGQDRLHDLPGQFAVVQCRQCGLIYLNPRPTKNEIGIYYPEEYEPYVFFDRTRRHWLARWDYQYGFQKKLAAIQKFVSEGRLLDIGCGCGSFMYHMREQGWEVYGVEISPTGTGYARQELGLNVFLGELQNAAFPTHHFDLVTLWNVLEHLHDPAGVLLEIRRVLKPNGLLVIAVPNVGSWDARAFGPAWVGYDVPRHLYTFSPITLESLLNRYGFAISQQRCLFGSHQAIVNSLSFLLHKPDQEQCLESLAKQIGHWRLLRLMAAPIFHLLDRSGKGSITTAFCQVRQTEEFV